MSKHSAQEKKNRSKEEELSGVKGLLLRRFERRKKKTGAVILTPARIKKSSKRLSTIAAAALVAENPELAPIQPAIQAAGEAVLAKGLEKVAIGVPEIHEAIQAEIKSAFADEPAGLSIFDWVRKMLKRDSE